MKNTKRALLLSALALVMCVTMLIGSTFAWFTDSASTAVNTIQSGTLDVELEYSLDDGATWANAEGQTLDFVKANGAPAGEAVLWEPNCTYELPLIRIRNNGNLALKYEISVIGATGDLELFDVIDFTASIDGAEEVALATFTGHLDAKDASSEILIKGHMDKDAGNDYQGLTISNIAISVLATQYTYESDSNDNQYDKDAVFAAKSETDLKNLLAKGGYIKVVKDITLTETLEVPAGVTATLDLNGKTLSGTAVKQVNVLVNRGVLNILGGTISSLGNDGGSAINNYGTLTVTDATLNGAPYAGIDGWWPSYAVNNRGGKVTMDNCTVTAQHGGVSTSNKGVTTLNNVKVSAGKNGITNAAVYTSGGGSVVINGGTYANVATDQNSTGASVINGAVTVNAGTFTGRIENYYGTPVINGGTFTSKPTKYAKGEVVDNGDGTWTVKPYTVSDADELATKLAEGKPVALANDITIGKINLTTGNKDVVIDAAGHKITTTDSYGIEVAAGKNITISNADVVMTKDGDYITYAAGFKISNGDYAGATITLKNCKISMANEDWSYAVNMPASVKNLNFVIDNCELEGAIAVQCWGDNNTITITNSKIKCSYTTNAMYTSYCVALQNDGTYIAENNTLIINNCEFSYTGVDNFDREIMAVNDNGNNNTIIVTNCTYDEKVVAY